LYNNNYPHHFIAKVHKKVKDWFASKIANKNKTTLDKTNKTDTSDKTTKSFVRPIKMPYIQGLSEQITRHVKQTLKNNVRVVFSNDNSVRKHLMRVKPKMKPLLKNCIYKVTCSCGAVYIGQTRRALMRRIREHIRDMEKEQNVYNKNHNQIAHHVQTNNHVINLKDIIVIHFERRYHYRTAAESMAMESENGNVVSQTSRKTGKMYTRIIKKLGPHYFKEKARLFENDCYVPPTPSAPQPERVQPQRICRRAAGVKSNKIDATANEAAASHSSRYALRPRAVLK
jgi:hypothetical protein